MNSTMTEDQKQAERAQYREQYVRVLAQFREVRQAIQDAYAEGKHQSKLAGDAQRAAGMGGGQVSCIGRSVEDVRQENADYQAGESDEAWDTYWGLMKHYQLALQQAMVEAGIPRDQIHLFRNPVVV